VSEQRETFDPLGRRYAPPVTTEDSLRRAEELLTKVEQARARLETTAEPEAALDVLGELADLAKEVEAEIQRAKREAEAEADAER
jgi:poly(A) polymerase Pap1